MADWIATVPCGAVCASNSIAFVFIALALAVIAIALVVVVCKLFGPKSGYARLSLSYPRVDATPPTKIVTGAEPREESMTVQDLNSVGKG